MTTTHAEWYRECSFHQRRKRLYLAQGQQAAPSPPISPRGSIKPTTPVLPWIIKHRSGPRLVSESWQLMDSGCEHRGEYPDRATDNLTAVRETRIRALIRSSRSWQSGKFRVARHATPGENFAKDVRHGWHWMVSQAFLATVWRRRTPASDRIRTRVLCRAAPLLLSFPFFGLDELSLPLGAQQLEFPNVGQDVAKVLFVTALARSYVRYKGSVRRIVSDSCRLRRWSKLLRLVRRIFMRTCIFKYKFSVICKMEFKQEIAFILMYNNIIY